MECLNNIIGITRTPCECLEPYLPTGYIESTSGLYIDELPESPIHLNAVKGNDCSNDLAGILNKARENSVNEFKRELYKHLQGRFKSQAQPFDGFIGAFSNSRTLDIPDGYAGVRITGKKSGATMIVDKILTYFNTTATFDLFIYKRNELIKTISIQSVAASNKENTFDSIELPLADEYGYIDYSFIYPVADGFLPKDNAVSCNCGTKETTLKQYVSIYGITGTNVAAVTDFTKTQYTNGLLIGAEIRCSTDDLICNAYRNEFIKVAIEWSILRKAVDILITGILNSPTISRDNMANREQMYYNSKSLQKKFNNDVQWIAENMELVDNDCFVCNSRNDLYFKVGIIS